jgi:hypothetical protein
MLRYVSISGQPEAQQPFPSLIFTTEPDIGKEPIIQAGKGLVLPFPCSPLADRVANAP